MVAFSASGTYLVFACACAAASVWAHNVVPETKGLSLEDMDQAFGSDVGGTEADRKRQIEEELGLPQLISEIMAGEVDS